MRYERPVKIASLYDIEIRFVPNGTNMEVWFSEKGAEGHICWIDIKKITEVKKLYEALKKYGFKLGSEEDFEEKFSEIIKDYVKLCF
ncbi:MAG: hypothetical protein QXL88_02890 [Candidatus Pacearchaeota archaeon]